MVRRVYASAAPGSRIADQWGRTRASAAWRRSSAELASPQMARAARRSAGRRRATYSANSRRPSVEVEAEAEGAVVLQMEVTLTPGFEAEDAVASHPNLRRSARHPP